MGKVIRFPADRLSELKGPWPFDYLGFKSLNESDRAKLWNILKSVDPWKNFDLMKKQFEKKHNINY